MSSRCVKAPPFARAPAGGRSSREKRGGVDEGFSLARTQRMEPTGWNSGRNWNAQKGEESPQLSEPLRAGLRGEGAGQGEGACLRRAESSLWLGLQQSAAGGLGPYFWAGIMSSMDCPFSSFFSISTMSFTPSTTSCTCSTSDEPSRSALDTSNTEPTAAVSTPPVRAGGRCVKRK